MWQSGEELVQYQKRNDYKCDKADPKQKPGALPYSNYEISTDNVDFR